MNEKFLKRMQRVQKRKDAELVVRFTEWYCAAHHSDTERTPLVSDGQTLGIYGEQVPLLCPECSEFARYAEVRTAYCNNDPKPFCAFCEIKCYKPEMREYSRKVMRYSGPRSLLSRYWLRALAHGLQTFKYRRTSK